MAIKKVMRLCLPVAALVVFMMTPASWASTLFVNASATGANDGTSWADAYTNLQTAISTAAGSGGSVTAIWVAAGTYAPAGPGGPVTASFPLVNGVSLLGGFAGNEDPGSFDINDRDFAANTTILTGDLNGNDGPGFTNIADNVYHVVNAIGNNATAVIDGFTITGGNARTGTNPERLGGGIVMRGVNSPTVRHCVFIRNRGEFGGGIFSDSNNGPIITDCTFIDNLGAQQGGGIYCQSTGIAAQIRRCGFYGNSSPNGGGLYARSNMLVTDSVFSGNTANDGGGLYTIAVVNGFTMTNCSFTANTAGRGGAVHNTFGGPVNTPKFNNCIFWGNTATIEGNEMFRFSSTPTMRHCNVKDSGGSGGGWVALLGIDGGGNIDADPQFVDADGADNVAGTADDNLRLAVTSPCIDAGDNAAAIAAGSTLDRGRGTRFFDMPTTSDTGAGTAPIVDIGAYEAVVLDSDDDGITDADEINIYGTDPFNPDTDGDGLSDYDEIFVHFTDPLDPDTDGDGLLDGVEVDIAMGGGCPDPLNGDSDGDTLSDGDEIALGTDPCNSDTDGDGIPDNIDDQPLTPGVSGGLVESWTRAAADEILALNLSLFNGPNNNANNGRRTALSNRANAAANAIAAGDYATAIAELTSLLEKVDGVFPPPDWVHNTPERAALAAEIEFLILLIEWL